MGCLAKQQINFKFTYFSMRFIKHFTGFSMFGVKFVTECSRKFFTFEWVTHDFILRLINFMAENAYLHVYIISKQHTYNFEWFFLVLENFHKVRIVRNWSCRKYQGLESASNLICNITFALKSRSSINILLDTSIIFLSLSENGFLIAKMQSSSLANPQKQFSNGSCNNFILIVHFLKLPLSAAHSICSLSTETSWYQHFLTVKGRVLISSWKFVSRC